MRSEIGLAIPATHALKIDYRSGYFETELGVRGTIHIRKDGAIE